ncbi:MAG TPA: radical SAM protein, partial [Candidatus Nanoarchaeia archaeon]|nr:radical SAM protein [Candidatus Nanoarchaeia archaeon]
MQPRITLFFCPSYPTRVTALGHAPPLSLAYLAQYLQEAGYQPLAINGNEYVELPEERDAAYEQHTVQRMISLVEQTQPDILIISAWTYAMPFAVEFTTAYKVRNPHSLLLFGGINATHLPEDTLRLLPAVDLLVRGEGQHALLEVIQAWERSPHCPDFFAIRGVSYRSGRIVHTPTQSVRADLNTLPLLDFSAFTAFDNRQRENFYLLTSLGCPYTCSFCSNPGIWPGFRKYSAQYVVNQIRLLEQKFGDIQVSFWDSDFTVDSSRAHALCSAFASNGLSTRWFCYARLDEVGRELAMAMKMGGCRHMFFGLESTNPKVLEWYDKAKDIPAYLQCVPKALTACTDARISAILSIILGAPVETATEMRQTAAQALAFKQGHASVDQLEVGMLTLEIGSALWHRYRSGALAVRPLRNDALCESYSGYQYFTKK